MKFNQHKTADISMYHSTAPAEKGRYYVHHHAEYELSLFVSGSGTYSAGDKIYDFLPGDIFLFGSNEQHLITEIKSDEFGELDILNIHFSPRLLWANGDEAILPLIKLFSARSESFSNMLSRENPHTAEIRSLIHDIEREFTEKKDCFELKLKTILYSILICIFREYGYVQKNTNVSMNEQTRLQLSNALDYIDNNLGENLTLENIAKKATMSKTYFSTVFKKYNGISLWDYIHIKRIEMAKDLLRNSELTKIEISEKCGFSCVANFYKTFKHITGKTPGDYKK